LLGKYFLNGATVKDVMQDFWKVLENMTKLLENMTKQSAGTK